MSPRPRQTSDDEIVAATMRVMMRLSPARLTLAAVARESGVVPATLIQRFGTKRNLLLATVRRAPQSVGGQFAAGRARFKSPIKTLIEVLVECTGLASTPEAMANGLAYLQIDITDAEFRVIAREQSERVRQEIRKLLDEAIAAGELRQCDTKRLAGLVQSVSGGSMINWALYRQGALAAWVRRDLKLVLAPWQLHSTRSSTDFLE